MRSLHGRAAARGHAVVGVVVLLASTASAQTRDSRAWTYGLAVGSPAAGLPIPEAVVGLGRATWHSATRLAFRSEVTLSHLPAIQESFAASPPCPPETACSAPPRKPRGVAGISEQLLVNDDYLARGESSGSYYVLGGGIYRQVSPSAVGSIGGAIEGGLGLKLGVFSLEAKAVYIRHWIGGDSGLIPVTIGYTW